MTINITIGLSEDLFERAKQYAARQQREISDAITELLDEALPVANGEENGDDNPWSGQEEAMERERQAYIAMHPKLKKKYLGKHVAIFGGQLVDQDDDYAALYARIDKKYPNEFVWLTTVREEPIRTATLFSPRFNQAE
jgi:hypothetical protein